MNKHHKELIVQFDLLIGVQQELKESFNIYQSTWQNKNEFPCLIEINQWEEEVINRIRQIAADARITANEMMVNNISDIHRRLDQLAFDIQRRQQEGNYLDNDINEVKSQLVQLNDTIQHINEKIRVNYTATNKVNWNSLLYIATDKKSVEKRFSFPEFHFDSESPQEKIRNNLRKLIRPKHSSFKCNTSSLFEPIILTSFDSNSRQYSYPSPQSTISHSLQKDSFSDDDSFNQLTFKSVGHDQLLPQASDA